MIKICLSAAYAGIGHDGQGVGLRDTLGSGPGQDLVERVAAVAFQVQQQVNGGDQVTFELPRALTDDPADEGVVGHPRRQGLFSRHEGPSGARPDSPQLDAQLCGEQAAQRLA